MWAIRFRNERPTDYQMSPIHFHQTIIYYNYILEDNFYIYSNNQSNNLFSQLAKNSEIMAITNNDVSYDWADASLVSNLVQ